MEPRVAIVISPNWKDYAKRYLSDCIGSIRQQDFSGEIKVFLTDNESSEASRELIRRLAPEAELIANEDNDGFAKGNNDAMKRAVAESFDFIMLLNMDAVMEADCLKKLIESAGRNPDWGAIQPRIMLYQDKGKINSLGNMTHFLGFGYCVGYNETWHGQAGADKIHYPSGAAVLLRRAALEQVGYFDEIYWMYNEDQELGWRIWLSGRHCLLMPDALVYHKYEFAKSIKQFYWMDRNRIISLLLCYRILTLILILPAFLVMEMGLILFSVKGGWFKEKLRVWAFFLSLRNCRMLLKSRQRNQSIRKVKDREIMPLISGRIWYQEIDDWKLRVVNPFFSAYFAAIKYLIRW